MTPFDKYNFFKLSIINDNIENTFNNFKKYLTERKDNFKSQIYNHIDFDLICDRPDLDYNADKKFMLYAPKSNPSCTVFFSNLIDGWNTAVYNYARLFKKEIYQIGFTVNKKSDKSPAYFFVNYNYNDKDEFIQRVVHLIKENQWVFYENSEEVKPLSIEKTEYYTLKRKTERLNNTIILEYMKKAGFDLSDSDFFETNGPVFYCDWN